MNSTDTLEQTEIAIAGLSRSEKKRLLKWLERDVEIGSSGIEKNPNIMGGVARIRGTRIPVWLLRQAQEQGVNEADLLRNYPNLRAEDLVNAWAYAAKNRKEIEKQIAENERED